jgi:hypothetical protein
MKTTNLKYIAYALSALMLMQSCIVYNKTPVSVEEAIATNRRVKVYTTENETYEFKKLVKEKENIYGIIDNYGSNKQARLRIDLASYIKEIDTEKGLAKILLPFEIKEVYTKNRTKSILSLWPVWVPAILVGLAFATGGIGGCC